jgi:hypothetical protein
MSFLKMYRTLKNNGVENNKFFLKLYDPDLMKVDPHDKKLSKEIQSKILVEIIKNPFYFIREVVRIPAPGKSLQFDLNRGTLAVLWAVLNNINISLLLPRQRGKTIGIACLLSWVYDFGTTNSAMIFSNKSVSDANNNLKRLKDIRAALPPFVYQSVINDKDTNNVESIVGAKRNNKINCSGQPLNDEMADKQGRGQTVPFLWYDEFAFLKFNDTIYKSAGPAQSKIAEVAEANGKPYAKIITTTPNNIDSPEGAFCKQLIDGAAQFSEDMYDWSKDEIKEYIQTNSDNDFLHIEFTWQQLGLTKQWYDKECRALANDSLKIKRELDLQWTKSSDNSVFGEEQIDTIYALLPEEASETVFLDVNRAEEMGTERRVLEKYMLKVYAEIDPEKRYFIGVDTGGGTGRDNSAFVIVDEITLEPIAVFKSPKINTSYYTTLLYNLVTEILPNAILVIERNSYGKTLIDNLVRIIPDNIFYDIPLADKEKEKGKVAQKENIKYGIDTTEVSRNAMIDLLVGMVNDEPEKLAIPEIFDDIKNLVYTKKGKVEHERGCHDDVLFSYLFVRYVFAFSNTIHLFLRREGSIKDNAAVVTASNRTTRAVSPSEVNRVTKLSNDIMSLSIEELITIRDRGITPQQYISQKYANPNVDSKRQLKINQSTFALLKR